MRTFTHTYQGKTFAFDSELGYIYGDTGSESVMGWGIQGFISCKKAVEWDFGVHIGEFLKICEES